MRYVILCLFVCSSVIALAQQGDQLLQKTSLNSFDLTIEKLKTAIESKGLTIFNVIEHHLGAEKAGMKLDKTTVVIFGNPKIGTSLMHCDQTIGIELPLKILVYENPAREVSVAYRLPQSWQSAYSLGDCSEVIKKITAALDGLSTAACQ